MPNRAIFFEVMPHRRFSAAGLCYDSDILIINKALRSRLGLLSQYHDYSNRILPFVGLVNPTYSFSTVGWDYHPNIMIIQTGFYFFVGLVNPAYSLSPVGWDYYPNNMIINILPKISKVCIIRHVLNKRRINMKRIGHMVGGGAID